MLAACGEVGHLHIVGVLRNVDQALVSASMIETGMCCLGIAFGGIKGRTFCEDPGARHVVDLEAYAVGILE